MPATKQSLEPPHDAVKEPKLEQKTTPARGSLARLVEGWELGAITVGLVLSAALLAVPRAASPGVFPVPLVDGAEARANRESFARLADRAEREGLPFETRAVGDAVRRLGVALAGGTGDPEHLSRLLGERVPAAIAAGQLDALLRLRAVQARMFVRVLREHDWHGPPSAELTALGGDFATRALRNGWVDREGCVASDDELTTLFARRWTELAHLRDDPRFKPTLGELRRYFRFLLLHPERDASSEPRARQRAGLRLRYVEALARLDTEYPLELARGCLLGELSMMPESAQALGRHLARPPSGEWNLRARNYLLFAAKGRVDAAELLPLE
jgi:hypothetical protein